MVRGSDQHRDVVIPRRHRVVRVRRNRTRKHQAGVWRNGRGHEPARRGRRPTEVVVDIPFERAPGPRIPAASHGRGSDSHTRVIAEKRPHREATARLRGRRFAVAS